MSQSESLVWGRCQGGVWCKLNAVNLAHSHFDNLHGVYMIWHGGKRPAVVYVGTGNIREQLEAHRTRKDIQEYASSTLFVTWARVDPTICDGVKAHLDSYWNPKVKDEDPVATSIAVNSPWGN